MKLLSVVIAHDRLELTRRTVASYLATVTVPHLLVVIDNASTDGTADWLRDLDRGNEAESLVVLPFDVNAYPGVACNNGWRLGLDLGFDPTVLHRSDNDVEYQPGWCDEVEACFDAFPDLGQLGLLDMHDEGLMPVTKCRDGVTINVAWPNVGGNCVIRRELWDAGLRFDERTWPEFQGRETRHSMPNEDAIMSEHVVRMGWRHAHVTSRIAVHLGHDWEQYPDYYSRTAVERGFTPDQLKQHFDTCERRRKTAASA
ncbi:MAG TPA: hypothetical protein VMV41_09760 [Cellulomonadaceae bacterium]|nr:hypothetical protein [Cellulomonadaceae bacterium]